MCRIEWCETEKIKARGYCGRCYLRQRKGLDLTSPPRGKVAKTATPEERLRFHGWTVTDSGCWEWGGRRDDKGYGVLALRDRKQVFAHRTAFAVWNGDLDPSLAVCHTCDNPPCINPEHLWLGSQGENLRDMVQKFRSGASRLDYGSVTAIRSLRSGLPETRGERTQYVQSVADKFGVGQTAVRDIWSGKTWKALND